MANRYKQQFQYSYERELVKVLFKVNIAAAGAPTLVANDSRGVASIIRNSTGNYTLTLQDKYARLMNVDSIQSGSATPSALDMTIVSAGTDIQSAKTIQLQFLSPAGAVTDPDNGQMILGMILLSNVLKS